ncbi:MAG: DUF2541 domain-containing protein [Hyphomicrobiaceae bacterium]
MFRRLILAGVALAAAGMVSSASAQDRWVNIGQREISLFRGFDVIDLGGAKGSYKGFRIVLTDGRMVLSNIQVRYSDGTAHNERRPINLNRGERTRPMDLGRTEHFVEGMTFCFNAVAGGKATIRVEGLQSPGGRKASKPPVTAAITWPAACPGSKPTVIAGASGHVETRPTSAAKVEKPAGTVLPGGAVLFGWQNVGLIRDRDVIRIGANLGQFDRIQFRVLNNDIHIRDMDVVYVDGTTQKLVVNADVKRNSRTRWLDIQGDKFIKEIQMVYRSKVANLKGQARIEVYGQFSPGWLGPDGRGRKYNEGWVLLGSQTAERFLRTETDVIPVGRNEGRFKRVRITVTDRALVFDELRIVYTDNQEEVIPVKTTIAANSTYGPVELKSGSRSIKEVRARYRSAVIDAKAAGRGASVVRIWAQH